MGNRSLLELLELFIGMRIPYFRLAFIFLLTISENVQLNHFDTRMLQGESKITEVGGTGREDGP